ncbi:hypothetical protein [Chlamydiifrater phoenicopteri]|uniref:hypothetical protein n=1 Tax=Chlamydiifrater phoenicopteri TaxID=2681469 RepID=UPI001BCF0A4A|nr:hypothetical protein [Chlamydiifrater phoenicopteri]
MFLVDKKTASFPLSNANALEVQGGSQQLGATLRSNSILKNVLFFGLSIFSCCIFLGLTLGVANVFSSFFFPSVPIFTLLEIVCGAFFFLLFFSLGFFRISESTSCSKIILESSKLRDKTVQTVGEGPECLVSIESIIESQGEIENVPRVGSSAKLWINERFQASRHIKKNFKDKIVDVSVQIKCLFPAKTAEAIAKERSQWPHTFKVEYLYRNQPEKGVEVRCRREWQFILLGFFSFEEIQALSSIYQEELKLSGATGVDLHLLYAKCLKVYPKLIAAEAAYLAWIREAFPYLSNASSSLFQDSDNYRRAFFDSFQQISSLELHGSSRRVLAWLERFTGWIPACLSVFQTNPLSEGMLVCPQNIEWDWDFYCTKVAAFCRQTVFIKPAFGEASDLLDFVFNGTPEEQLYKQGFYFDYDEGRDFFYLPVSLWKIGLFCDKDSELRDKVEEGLALLSESGVFGRLSLEDVQAMERKILGLR